jgi:hypothetical protein
MSPRTSSALLASVLFAAVLAGCSGGTPPAQPQETGPADPLGSQVGAEVIQPSANATLGGDTPFLLSATAGPAGDLTAFRWTVPEGAILEWRPFQQDPSFVVEMLAFEMVPVLGEGVALEEFAILVYSLADGEAVLASSHVGTPMAGRQGVPPTVSEFSVTPALEPGFLQVSAGSLQAGDDLAFVLVGRSAAPGPFGLLLSPLSTMPEPADSPPGTADDLLRNRTAVSLAAAGTGAGFQAASYLNVNVFFGPFLTHYEVASAAVQVEDALPRPAEPVVGARRAVISSSFDGPGFSQATILTLQLSLAPACPAAGTYEAAASLHGTEAGHRGVIAPAILLGVVVGLPIMVAVGEGEGPSSASLSMTQANACMFDITFFDALDLGATLAQLVGVPALVGGSSAAGLLGDIPPSFLVEARGDLVLFDGRAVRTLPGLAAGVPMPGDPGTPPSTA